MMKILMIVAVIALSSCSYFAQPDAEHYEYEEITSLCARVMSYPDRIIILYVDCQKAPGARKVQYFGQSLEEE